MGGGGGPSNVTQTTKVQLPKWAEPYAKSLLSRASSLSSRPYTDLSPYALFEPMAPETQAGLYGITQRALLGSPVVTQAQVQLAKTLGGKYLSPKSNPYLAGAYDAAARKVVENYTQGLMPHINAMATRAGSFGGSQHQLLQSQTASNMARDLGELASNIFYKAYQDERANQMRSMLFAPEMAKQDYVDMQALLGVGDVWRQYGQEWRDLLARQFYQARDWPAQQLEILMRALPAAVGGTSVSTTTKPNPDYVSPFSSIAGGALAGTSLGLLAAMAGLNPSAAAALGAIPLIGGIVNLF